MKMMLKTKHTLPICASKQGAFTILIKQMGALLSSKKAELSNARRICEL
jgi:hypothetical protein